MVPEICFYYISGKCNPILVIEKDKKKTIEKSVEKTEKEKEKSDNNAKKKAPANGVPIITKVGNSGASKDKELAVIKLRRKSSTVSESSNPVVLLRRKSFAGATEALRKKTLENSVTNSLSSSSSKSSVS